MKHLVSVLALSFTLAGRVSAICGDSWAEYDMTIAPVIKQDGNFVYNRKDIANNKDMTPLTVPLSQDPCKVQFQCSSDGGILGYRTGDEISDYEGCIPDIEIPGGYCCNSWAEVNPAMELAP